MTEELEALAEDIIKKLKHRETLTFTSKGVRYTFYWHRQAQVLMVTTTGRAHKDRPDIETLAAKLRERRVCPICATVFPRNGKQRYCSTAHANAGRARRRRNKLRTERKELARLKERAEMARMEAAMAQSAEIARKAQRAKDRRRQRARVKHEQRLNAELGGHGLAPKVPGASFGRTITSQHWGHNPP